MAEGSLARLPAPKPRRALSPALTGSVGVAGTKIFAGLILDDYNPNLSGLKAVPTYDQMRRSEPMVQAVQLACELPIRSARWYVEPASDDPTHIAIADFIHDSLFNFGHQSVDDLLRLRLGMLWAGFAWLEKIFKYDERGYLMWDQFAYRHQSTVWRWNMDEKSQDDLKSVTQLAPPTYDYHEIPAEKLLIDSFRREGNNYQGLSLFRAAYKPWFILQYLEKVANVGYERMAGGLPVIQIPLDAEDAEVQKAVAIVENLRMGDEAAGVTIPENLPFSILEIGGKMMDHLNAYLEQQRLGIGRSALAGFINMPGGNVGSFALSRDSSQLFLDSLGATADQLIGGFNQQEIPQLLDLNFRGLKRDDYPRLTHSKIGQRDIRYLGRSLGELAKNRLLTPGVDLEEHLREILDLPDIPDEQRLILEEHDTAFEDDNQDRGAAGVPKAPPTASVPAPSNLPAARVIASQPWRPSTRMRRMREIYRIRAAEAKPSRTALNAKAHAEVEVLRGVVREAMSTAREEAKQILADREPHVSP